MLAFLVSLLVATAQANTQIDCYEPPHDVPRDHGVRCTRARIAGHRLNKKFRRAARRMGAAKFCFAH
jgi:hypothetical protein